MSRDLITILIVLFCIAALVFLIVKTVNLSSNEVSEPGEDYNYLYDDTAAGGTGEEDTAGLPDTDTATPPSEGPETEEPSVEYIGKDEIAPPREEREEPRPSSFDQSGDYLVIAGAFRIRQNADNEASRLRGLGYGDAETGLFNNGAYASVIVDRFSSLSAAQDLVRELKNQHGVEAYVQASRSGGNN